MVLTAIIVIHFVSKLRRQSEDCRLFVFLGSAQTFFSGEDIILLIKSIAHPKPPSVGSGIMERKLSRYRQKGGDTRLPFNCLITARRSGREKVIGGEAHLLEEGTGIARIGANRAFLFGNAEFTCRKNKRHRSFNADDAEKTQRYIKALDTEIICHVTSAKAAYIFGNLIAGAAAATEFVLFFHKLHRKADGRRNLNHNLWHICLVVAGNIREIAAEIVAELLRGENTYVSFASEKHAFFVINRNSAEFLTLSSGNAGFKMKLEIEAYIYRIVSLVEGDGINGYMCPEHLGTFAADVCGSVDNILTAFGKKDLKIFKTVFVFYRIVYFVTVNAGSAVVVSAVGRHILA